MPTTPPAPARRNAPWTPLQRRTWLAEQRRKHRLLPAPVLRAVYPDLLQWDWDLPNPCKWNVWQSLDGGATYILVSGYWMYGDARQFAPAGGGELHYIVGVDANGLEITQHSNAVRPDDAQPPVVLEAPSLICLGSVSGDGTWRAVAPQAVDDWQFCTTDTAFDPDEASFDQWVDSADSSDTDFTTIDDVTATVTIGFNYCTARYRVGATWSSWSSIVERT